MNDSASSQKPYWSQSTEELLTALESSTEGISSSQARARLSRYGYNLLKPKKQSTAVVLFLSQFKSPITLILLAATVISAVLGDWIDTIIILLIVLGSGILSFVQEYGANNSAEKLRSKISTRSSLLRDGQSQSLPSDQVVPGDVVLLSAGSLIPADGILLEGKDFFVNQSVLTGETFPVEKEAGVVNADAGLAERTNTLFMGTNVRSGEARMLVVQTGASTAFGQIASRLSLRQPETDFERGIRQLGYLLTEVMFILTLVIFAVNVLLHKPILDSLLFSIALAVGLTPQLLPAIISINLSKGSQSMAQHGVIVRRLESIENFGSMDVLCTDKTGTLTAGVVKLDAALDFNGKDSPEVLRDAYLNAHFQTGMTNPLDEAILATDPPDIAGVTKVDEIPYDFVRRRLSLIVQEKDQVRMITKGALDQLVAVSSHILQDGKEIPLGAEQHASIQENFHQWSQKGFRVLGLATRTMSEQKKTYHREDEKDLTLTGFLLFFDPPKEDVKKTIQQLSQLGVDLKIITGDNQLVAQYTCEAVGLECKKILTGADLDRMQHEAMLHAVQNTTVFAEVDPNQKERIILALKKTGHVVGYLGDGINDAPSLHSADVGISVDNAVDVAKEAADFVLLKQDLDVLQRGIIEGRKTFANTLKYVFMATSANFGNMFSMAGASLFLPYLPMLPKQILLINFMTDLPEMTIASDNVDDAFVQRPHRWDVAYIRRFMLVFGPLSSIFDYLTFGVLLWGIHASPDAFHTGWFIESVLSAMVVVFALRTRLPFQRSRPSRTMLLVTAGVAALTLLLPYSPIAGALGFTPLPLITLLIIALIISGYFFSAEAAKRWFFKKYEL